MALINTPEIAGHSSSLRLLLNAEPFGFGPTAAIADVFPFLRGHFAQMGYVGSGHTLDLQRPLAYDAIHDLSGLEAADADRELAEIFARYDLFFTALDFAMAQKALAAGLKVFVYDPLTWYWQEIPPVVRDVDLYIAQNFFGVKERLAREAEKFRSPQVVPPIIGEAVPRQGDNDIVLVNLGGLNNPYWSAEGTLTYARLILEAFLPDGRHKDVIVAANTAIARALPGYGVQNLSRSEMQNVLARAKYALMTPGLGNVYDAARFDIPTIWLPPANDSQGEQLALLSAHDMVDGAVDWHELLDMTPVDYSSEQVEVLRKVACAVESAAASAQAKEKFASLLSERSAALAGVKNARVAKLVQEFGAGGAPEVARLIVEQAKLEAARLKTVRKEVCRE